MKYPSHVAIIMDGNGRWARERNQPRREGHKKGVEVLKNVVEECSRLQIPCLTVYAFSTENWQRPTIEVNFLMKLLENTLHREIDTLNANQVKVKVIGRRQELASSLVKEINYVEDLTADNEGLLFNIALNYGGRAEIIDVVKKIVNREITDCGQIDEELVNSCLYQPHVPEVEFLIRTGGEKRVSNFLLWQIAYAEFYFTEKYWPDFTPRDLRNALDDFRFRQRRFGALDDGGDKNVN